jgi:Asp/Glu/hydantoin racemase
LIKQRYARNSTSKLAFDTCSLPPPNIIDSTTGKEAEELSCASLSPGQFSNFDDAVVAKARDGGLARTRHIFTFDPLSKLFSAWTK